MSWLGAVAVLVALTGVCVWLKLAGALTWSWWSVLWPLWGPVSAIGLGLLGCWLIVAIAACLGGEE